MEVSLLEKVTFKESIEYTTKDIATLEPESNLVPNIIPSLIQSEPVFQKDKTISNEDSQKHGNSAKHSPNMENKTENILSSNDSKVVVLTGHLYSDVNQVLCSCSFHW